MKPRLLFLSSGVALVLALGLQLVLDADVTSTIIPIWLIGLLWDIHTVALTVTGVLFACAIAVGLGACRIAAPADRARVAGILLGGGVALLLGAIVVRFLTQFSVLSTTRSGVLISLVVSIGLLIGAMMVALGTAILLTKPPTGQ
jgi:hypothetical protein